MFQPTDHNVDLSEEEFRLLRDFIHERFGLFFDDNQRASLRTRLAGRLSGLDLVSFEDYYHYLRFGPQRTEEQQRMVTHLTNNETYFYRDPYQLQAFAREILPALAESNRAERRLRLLSAGCSTGEEAYTLAALVRESGLFEGWDVEIVGSDSFKGAVRSAVKRLRVTHQPVGLIIDHHYHAWVMTGFEASADPKVDSSFVVQAVYIMGPLYPRPQQSNGLDPPPDTRLTRRELAHYLNTYIDHLKPNGPWEGKYVTIQP